MSSPITSANASIFDLFGALGAESDPLLEGADIAGSQAAELMAFEGALAKALLASQDPNLKGDVLNSFSPEQLARLAAAQSNAAQTTVPVQQPQTQISKQPQTNSEVLFVDKKVIEAVPPSPQQSLLPLLIAKQRAQEENAVSEQNAAAMMSAQNALAALGIQTAPTEKKVETQSLATALTVPLKAEKTPQALQDAALLEQLAQLQQAQRMQPNAETQNTEKQIRPLSQFDVLAPGSMPIRGSEKNLQLQQNANSIEKPGLISLQNEIRTMFPEAKLTIVDSQQNSLAAEKQDTTKFGLPLQNAKLEQAMNNVLKQTKTAEDGMNTKDLFATSPLASAVSEKELRSSTLQPDNKGTPINASESPVASAANAKEGIQVAPTNLPKENAPIGSPLNTQQSQMLTGQKVTGTIPAEKNVATKNAATPEMPQAGKEVAPQPSNAEAASQPSLAQPAQKAGGVQSSKKSATQQNQISGIESALATKSLKSEREKDFKNDKERSEKENKDISDVISTPSKTQTAWTTPAENKEAGLQNLQPLPRAALERARTLATQLQGRGGVAKVQISDNKNGTINLEIRVEQGNKVFVEVRSADDKLKDDLKDGIDALKKSLENQKLNLAELKFTADASLSQGGTNSNSSQQQQQQRNEQTQNQQQFRDQSGEGFRNFFNQGNGGSSNGNTSSGGERFLSEKVSTQERTRDFGRISAANNNKTNVQRSANGSLKVSA